MDLLLKNDDEECDALEDKGDQSCGLEDFGAEVNQGTRLTTSESIPPNKGLSELLDEVLETLGNPGRFGTSQIVLFILSMLASSFPLLNIVFIGYQTPHKCAKLANETETLTRHSFENDSTAFYTYHKCSIDLSTNHSGHIKKVASFSCLNGNDYNGLRHISFVSEWDFVCEKKTGLTEFVQTVLMAGQMVGAFTASSLADKFGRKWLMITCQVLSAVVGIIAAFSPNIYVLIAMRFVTGVCQQGTLLIGWTLLLEGIVPRHRRYIGALLGHVFTWTLCLFALCAWLLKDSSWRNLQLITACVNVNVLLYPMFLSESARWLLANKKYDAVLAILKRAAKFNKKDVDVIKNIFMDKVTGFDDSYNLTNIGGSSMVEKRTQYTVLDILRHKVLLKPTMVVFVLWITCSMTYFGLALTSSSLAGDRHLNFFLIGVVDAVGDIGIFLYLDRVGRRVLCLVALSVTATGLITSSLLMAFGKTMLTKILTTVFFVIGKFGISLCFNLIFIYTPELYPTNLRTVGLGLCSSVARIGGMVSPYARPLADVVTWGPGAIFTTMCVLSGAMVFLLPETRGRALPMTIEELKLWKKKSKIRKTSL